MVFKLYDKNMNYLNGISEYKDLRISEELETGYKVAQFSLPYNILVVEEQKIEIDGYLYVIKEVNMEDLGLYDVYCRPYFGKLHSKHIDSITGYNMAFPDIMNKILEETDWSVVVAPDLTGSFQMNLHRKSAIEAIELVGQLFQAEYKFDTKNRVIYAYNKRGKIGGNVVLDNTNLLKCQVQSNTYDLITRLIPIGKDDTTIGLVNNGQLWVENFQYTKEIIVGYYVDSNCANADDLLKIARSKVLETGQPQSTYKLFLIDFPLDVQVGDEVRVIDKVRGLDTVKRVSKTVIYPSTPEESYIQLGSLEVSFDKIYKDFKKAQGIVNEDTLRSINEITKTYE